MTNESPCDRIRAARERLGMMPKEVASAMGLSSAWYDHLELVPGEVFSNVSLAHLKALGQTLGLEPATILAGDGAPYPQRRPFEDVVDGLRRQMESAHIDADTLGERLGWDIRALLADPEQLWNFNVDGLRDVCEGVGIDWLAVLPRLT
jgi:transcriptional regulator with XRE-family HTH domain